MLKLLFELFILAAVVVCIHGSETSHDAINMLLIVPGMVVNIRHLMHFTTSLQEFPSSTNKLRTS